MLQVVEDQDLRSADGISRRIMGSDMARLLGVAIALRAVIYVVGNATRLGNSVCGTRISGCTSDSNR